MLALVSVFAEITSLTLSVFVYVFVVFTLNIYVPALSAYYQRKVNVDISLKGSTVTLIVSWRFVASKSDFLNPFTPLN